MVEEFNRTGRNPWKGKLSDFIRWKKEYETGE